MIEESYVSFDTAKMLKEAGFDCNCRKWYSQQDNDVLEWEADAGCNWNVYNSDISRPTQALAARWLRETHNIHVFPFFEYARKKWCYGVSDTTAFCAEEGMDMPDECSLSCEEAFEVGLQYVLKLIKK